VSTERDQQAAAMAEGMMEIAAAMEPMHDFARGQVAYFLAQGYKPAEALAMSAAEFVSIFGANILRELPEDWQP
jgi:hypothetical protein